MKITAQEVLATKWVFSWQCPGPPDIMQWQSATEEDLDDYGFDIIDYIEEHAEDIEPQELFDAVGGEQEVLDTLYGGSAYDDFLKIADDDYISWYKSVYPDGTPIYFHTHSGIEHVFEPEGYNIPDSSLEENP